MKNAHLIKAKRAIAKWNPKQCVDRLRDLEETHPGVLIKRCFMMPNGITPERVAKEVRKPLEEINGIIEGKRPITPELAERLERSFGWPAAVVLDWKRLHDLLVKYWDHEEWLANAKMHVAGLEIVLAEVEDVTKMLRKDYAFIKKRIARRYRLKMRRIHRTHRPWAI